MNAETRDRIRDWYIGKRALFEKIFGYLSCFFALVSFLLTLGSERLSAVSESVYGSYGETPSDLFDAIYPLSISIALYAFMFYLSTSKNPSFFFKKLAIGSGTFSVTMFLFLVSARLGLGGVEFLFALLFGILSGGLSVIAFLVHIMTKSVYRDALHPSGIFLSLAILPIVMLFSPYSPFSLADMMLVSAGLDDWYVLAIKICVFIFFFFMFALFKGYAPAEANPSLDTPKAA